MVSGCTAQLFLNLGNRMECVVSITPGRLYPRERPGTHCTGGWVGNGAGLDSAENLAPPGFDPRTFQPVAQSLYRLSYPGSQIRVVDDSVSTLFQVCVIFI
jgi:hypothetical protein